MTTITAETVSQSTVTKAWRFVATFVAGAAVAGGIAVGVGIVDHSTPAAAHPGATVQTQPASDDPTCLKLRGPC